MELETARLYLRKFESSDITPVYLDALNDPSIIGQTEARHCTWDISSATEFVQQANEASSILFGVFLKNNNKPIGNIRLFNIHSVHRRAELSLLFYDKKEWSKGYATESVNAVIEYGFNTLGLHRIIADYYETNIASSKMFKKVGFVIEGVFKDHFLVEDNEFVDSIRVAKVNSI